jgi:glycosyltransferase involved in cell wall biosynthesis
MKVGAKRFSILSEFLAQKYGEVHILTVSEKHIQLSDKSLQAKGHIHRTGMFPPNPPQQKNRIKRILQSLWIHGLCVIDPFSGWIMPAFTKGLKIIRTHKINTVIATCPPFSAMVIGFLLSRTMRAKLIMDYRDPWSNRSQKFCKLCGKKMNEFFEKQSVKYASDIVFCSHIMKNDFLQKFGQYTKANLHVITNGFEARNTVEPLPLGKAKKNMLYAGVFSGERRIKLLIKPFLQLLKEGVISKQNFCLHVFGKLQDEDKNMIAKYDLQAMIKERSPVSYEQIIKYMKAADILLLISGTDVNYAIPYKFYDYYSVKRPILALAPENSAVAQIMNETDCGQLALIDSEKSIFESLRKILVEDKVYTFSGPQHYTWDKIGDKYCEVIDEAGVTN